MRKNLSKTLIASIAAVVMTGSMSACGNQQPLEKAEEDFLNSLLGRTPLEEAFENVFDAGTFYEYDMETMTELARTQFDGWKYDIREKDKGGCTVIGKVIDDKMIVARNMDLSISYKPAYYFRTEIEGCYKTVCICYTNFMGETGDVVRRSGISNAFLQMLPISAADAMNDKGLYVEANMRTTENFEDGTSKFGSSGTNPDSDIRLALSQLPVYLPMHCATVDEALKVVREELDIYSLNSDLIDWPLCLYMADATGNYGLLEIVNNEIIWHDKAPCQTNYYVNEKYQSIEDYKAGYGENGRYETAVKGLDAAESAEDMWNAINDVTYYQVYDPDTCKFDPRSEYVGHDICGVEGMPTNWTTDVVLDEKNRPALEKYMRQNGEKIRGMTRDEQAKKGEYWESAYTILANCTDKTLKVRFFEDDSRTVELGFNE